MPPAAARRTALATSSAGPDRRGRRPGWRPAAPGGQRVGQTRVHRPATRRQRPGGRPATGRGPRRCWAGRGRPAAAPYPATGDPSGRRLRRPRTGSRPTATKRSAPTLTSWRQPNSRPLRSFSKAAIPMPTQAATARPAGASTTVSDGANEPSPPCERGVARCPTTPAPSPTGARPRPAWCPGRSPGAAPAPATSSQAMGERATGPTAKRMTSPQLGAVAPRWEGRRWPRIPCPASAVPTAQGKRQHQRHHHRLASRRLARATSAPRADQDSEPPPRPPR